MRGSICLALSGVAGIEDLDKSLVCQGKPVADPHVLSAFPLLELPRWRY